VSLSERGREIIDDAIGSAVCTGYILGQDKPKRLIDAEAEASDKMVQTLRNYVERLEDAAGASVQPVHTIGVST
jgi:hypothetical protein